MKWHPNFTVLSVVLPVLLWSAWKPYEGVTWWLEVAPVFIGFAALFVAQARGWRLSSLVLGIIALHMIILIVGGHYTYARVPLGEWWKEWFGFKRNHYDRLGHLFQGLTPALITRELFIRHEVIRRRGWRTFLTVCVCLAISAIYELFEWLAAVLSSDAAESFLGTQGDSWDTQSDLFCALIGSLVGLLVLFVPHDWSLRRLSKGTGRHERAA